MKSEDNYWKFTVNGEPTEMGLCEVVQFADSQEQVIALATMRVGDSWDDDNGTIWTRIA